MRLGKFAWTGILVLHLIVVATFWMRGSGDLLTQDTPSIAIALGRLAGLLAATLLLVQFFTLGRFPWLERVFGFDRLTRIHHRSGTWGFTMIVLHPLLLAWGYGERAGISAARQFLLFLGNDDIMLSVVGVLLLIGIIGSSIVIARRKLKYELWYFVHLVAYIAVFSVFSHQLEIGNDLRESAVFSAYWIAVYTGVFGSHFVFRFVRPLALFTRHWFVVTSVIRETDETVSIRIGGEMLERFRIDPGQFIIVRFFRRGFWYEAHPFSPSLPFDGTSIRITAKEVGDFTRKLITLPVGTNVLIDGPYGIFTPRVRRKNKILCIAGGIGITPIRSLFETFLRGGIDTALVYANRTERSIAFRDELDRIAAEAPSKVIHVLSNEPEFTGEKGRVSGERIARLIPDLLERDVYLCGPRAMLEALRRDLLLLHLPKAQLHYEEFSL